MNEILKMMNAMRADELDSLLMRGTIILEKKRKEEAEEAVREQERIRQEKIAAEMRRQEEIQELQRRLQALQQQTVVIPEEPGKVQGDQFVMYDAPRPAAQNTAPVQPAPQPAPAKPEPAKVSCPSCRQMNNADSLFCCNCGQRMTAGTAAPQAAPQPKPQPAPQPAPQPQAGNAQVVYADEAMKKWEKLPGETTMRGQHEIEILQPEMERKCVFHMEVTNQRILLLKESSGSRNAGMAARIGGGLVGSLIAEGVKAATGAGPKPYLAIPLTAVQMCGLQSKKEFVIVADRTYVLKNHSYEKFLPDLVARAKA